MLEGQLNREFLKFGNYPLSLSLSLSLFLYGETRALCDDLMDKCRVYKFSGNSWTSWNNILDKGLKKPLKNDPREEFRDFDVLFDVEIKKRRKKKTGKIDRNISFPNNYTENFDYT